MERVLAQDITCMKGRACGKPPASGDSCSKEIKKDWMAENANRQSESVRALRMAGSRSAAPNLSNRPCLTDKRTLTVKPSPACIIKWYSLFPQVSKNDN